MPEMPGWKRLLQEPNAIGWIAFFFLVLVIGFGSIYFGGGRPPGQQTHHAAR